MNTELGNTTLESLGILTGIEGYRAALADPPNWQARLDGESQWLDYEDKLDNCWSVWDARMIVHDSVVQWRRNPVEKREPMRYVVRPIELHDDIVFGEPNGHFVDINLRLPFAWNRKVATITVDERVDPKPVQPPVEDYRPCTRAEAEANPELSQMRFRCNNEPDLSWSSWVNLSDERCKGYGSLDYEFQTKASAATQPPVEPPGTHITWQRAQERVDAGLEVETQCDNGEWFAIVGEETPRIYTEWTYRIPLQPAEAKPAWSVSPEATAAEIERLTKRVNELVNCHDQDKRLLASALGSQKAAVAALEAERMHGCWLRNALEMCAKYFGDASVDSLRTHIAKTLRDIDETAGKESGG